VYTSLLPRDTAGVIIGRGTELSPIESGAGAGISLKPMSGADAAGASAGGAGAGAAIGGLISPAAQELRKTEKISTREHNKVKRFIS